MTALIAAILFTLGVSAVCSLLEAFILSVTTADIESLKKTRARRGQLLEQFRIDIEETTSAILALNTIANTMGATVVGWLAGAIFGAFGFAVITGGLVFGILFLSEILPKNIGVIYRKQLLPHLVFPLHGVRLFMFPFSRLAMHSVRLILDRESRTDEDHEEEIILLAEKHAKDGSLSDSERDIVSNALTLDNVDVSEIMTPRTVVFALDDTLTIEEVFREHRNLPFGRIPVYHENIDDVVGMVRRRDLLKAMADDEEARTVNELMSDPVFIPESASGSVGLQLFLKKHQQLAVVVDEFGSTVGVVAMEDIVEHIIGREIYEDSDIAVDMRELARRRAQTRAPVDESASDHSVPGSASVASS